MKRNNTATVGISVYSLSRSYRITLRQTEYSRTPSGKSWKSSPDTTETREIPAEHYYNYFDAVPFFRSLGGSETVRRSYTAYGYIPTTLISISPDRETKVVRHFTVEYAGA